MPSYKLVYFNIEGLAEPIRLSCKLGGLELEDVRIKFEEWPALKPTTPGGSLPVFYVDGEPHTQSSAVLRYLGHLTGQYPTDPMDAF